jgi:hypothetical protein
LDRTATKRACSSLSQYSKTSRWAPLPISTIATRRGDGPSPSISARFR